jgi:hypothetical protein
VTGLIGGSPSRLGPAFTIATGRPRCGFLARLAAAIGGAEPGAAGPGPAEAGE